MTAKAQLRDLTDEELGEIHRLARSRTDEARLAQRAQVIEGLAAGEHPGRIAEQVGLSRNQNYLWLHRFNDRGLEGLGDLPRTGRPPTHTSDQIAEVVAAALSDPQGLDLHFGCWTLDRLEVYLDERKGIPINRSRIDELLAAEGLRWRKQETWFGERVDPEFAEKSDCVPRQVPKARFDREIVN
ncbi:helix-turn-helix domain-containing protein [Isosphaeraceae bacterium EP7]